MPWNHTDIALTSVSELLSTEMISIQQWRATIGSKRWEPRGRRKKRTALHQKQTMAEKQIQQEATQVKINHHWNMINMIIHAGHLQWPKNVGGQWGGWWLIGWSLQSSDDEDPMMMMTILMMIRTTILKMKMIELPREAGKPLGIAIVGGKVSVLSMSSSSSLSALSVMSSSFS